jgi:ankyrin repeat protein
MDNSLINNQKLDTPSTPDNTSDNKTIKSSRNQLIRTSTTPSDHFGTPPKSNELNRQMSASPSLTTPVSAISAYLKQFLGLNAKTTKRSLSEEAECGSPESLSEWLRQGSDPNEVDAYGYTPLVNACLRFSFFYLIYISSQINNFIFFNRGCAKSAKILINNGANVNMHAQHGYCPLHAAAQVIIKTNFFKLSK